MIPRELIQRIHPAAVGLLWAWTLAGVSPAAADWLVLNDGTRVETAGPWEIKGKLVVFTAPGGSLSSLRLSEVDLEASQRATEEARAPKKAPEPEAPPEKRPILVLTDADVAHVGPRRMETGEEGEEQEAAATGEPVVVSAWELAERPLEEPVAIVGTVTNRSQDTATGITLKVYLYDEGGSLMASGDGILERTALPPGASTNFRVVFPGIYRLGAVKFEIRSLTFKTRTEPGPESSP